MADSIYSMMSNDFSHYTGPASGGYSLGGTLMTPNTSSNFMSGFSQYAGPVMGAIGAISGGIGAYFSAESQKSSLKFQSDMAAINARMAENTAQSILQAGSKEASNVGLRAGKVVGSQRASQGARGIVAGVGNAAEEIATTNLMKETDMMTINANATRAAWGARTQATNSANQSLLQGITANSISPFSAAGTSLMNGAAAVAPSWYKAFGGGGLN